MNFDIDKHTIFLTVHGSRCYGTNLPTSDYDFKGFAVPPKRYFLGHAHKFEQKEELVSKGHPHDRVIFDIRKFFSLAADCNPNIIEILYTDSSDHLVTTRWSQKVLENRNLFLSKRARNRFGGYALSQLHRIKSHRSWILNPIKEKPKRSSFGLPDDGNKVVSGTAMGAISSLQAEEYVFSDQVMDIVQKEKAYAAELTKWKQYENWKASRNPDRAELESKYGYDTKHALHLHRLTRMCKEIFELGEVIVKRPDAAELLAIRNGEWSYDKVVAEAERNLEEADAHMAVSSLPENPPLNRIDDLCVEVVEDFLRNQEG